MMMENLGNLVILTVGAHKVAATGQIKALMCPWWKRMRKEKIVTDPLIEIKESRSWWIMIRTLKRS